MENRIAELVRRNKELIDFSNKAIEKFNEVSAEIDKLKKQSDEACKIIQEFVDIFNNKGALPEEAQQVWKATDFINNKL